MPRYFEKGNPGKPKGAKNKLTITVRERVLDVFQELQSDPKANMVAWAKQEPTEFYKIAAKLIPMDLTTNGENFNLTLNLTPAKE